MCIFICLGSSLNSLYFVLKFSNADLESLLKLRHLKLVISFLNISSKSGQFGCIVTQQCCIIFCFVTSYFVTSWVNEFSNFRGSWICLRISNIETGIVIPCIGSSLNGSLYIICQVFQCCDNLSKTGDDILCGSILVIIWLSIPIRRNKIFTILCCGSLNLSYEFGYCTFSSNKSILLVSKVLRSKFIILITIYSHMKFASKLIYQGICISYNLVCSGNLVVLFKLCLICVILFSKTFDWQFNGLCCWLAIYCQCSSLNHLCLMAKTGLLVCTVGICYFVFNGLDIILDTSNSWLISISTNTSINSCQFIFTNGFCKLFQCIICSFNFFLCSIIACKGISSVCTIVVYVSLNITINIFTLIINSSSTSLCSVIQSLKSGYFALYCLCKLGHVSSRVILLVSRNIFSCFLHSLVLYCSKSIYLIIYSIPSLPVKNIRIWILFQVCNLFSNSILCCCIIIVRREVIMTIAVVQYCSALLIMQLRYHSTELPTLKPPRTWSARHWELYIECSHHYTFHQPYSLLLPL